MSPIDLTSAPKLCFVLDGLLLLGLVLLVTGVASNEWGVENGAGQNGWFGLWKTCKPIAKDVLCFPIPSTSIWNFDKYRALLVISAIMAVGALLLALAFTALPKFRTHKFCVILGCVCFIVVAADLVGIILFVADRNTLSFTTSVKYTFGWGLGVSAAGGAAFLVGAGLVFATAVCSLRSPPMAIPRPL